MKTLRLLWLALAWVSISPSRADFPTLALKPICLDQLEAPTTLCNAGDGSGRLFVCEQRGKIRIIQNGMLLPQPFLDLGSKLVSERTAFDERGLIGLVFHPGFANAGSPGRRRFYVFYSTTSPNAPGTTSDPVDCRSVIAEYRVSAADPNTADPSSERILLSFDKPQFNHNGGQLEFGPDGFLYIGTGDGGGAGDNDPGHTGGSASKPAGNLGNSQDKTKLLGKILRIDPLGLNGPGGQYGIPASNPFVFVGNGVREEIYAFGLRNPWRFSFDPPTGRLFCADVGQDRVEEVDLITAGGNYGWHMKEGGFDFDPTAPSGGGTVIGPIAQYEHPGLQPSLGLPALGLSVTGGCVYRGSAIPGLAGKYVFGDWSSSATAAVGTLLGLEETTPNNWTMSVLPLTTPNPMPLRVMAFGRDEQGEIYVATKVTRGPSQNDPSSGLPTGGIYKLVAVTSGTTTLQPLKDNTMFEENPTFSNGQGYLFAGATGNGAARRALLAFDVSNALPSGATPTGAALTLSMNKTIAGATDVSLHRVSENWGEGGSNSGSSGGGGAAAQTGDATWALRVYNTTAWTTQGGTFAQTASATTSVANVGTYTWSSAGMVADVKAWLANPTQNFGWILIGDETDTTAKRFSSREDFTPSLRPQLSITYLQPPPPTRREQWLQQHFPVGKYVDDAADLDGDGLANGIEYAFAFTPTASNPPGSGMQVSRTVSGGNDLFTITFRRDPRATDLTYRLQTSPDLLTWTTVVQSTGGGAPAGAAFVSEIAVPGEAPVTIVTARETLPPGARRFARLQVTRQ